VSESFHKPLLGREYEDYPSERFAEFALMLGSTDEINKMIVIIEHRIVNDPWNEALPEIRQFLVERRDELMRRDETSRMNAAFWSVIQRF
jgi:hypothetical protein